MISIAFITSRYEPRFDWFFDSLAYQLKPSDEIEIILIDFFAQVCDAWTKEDVEARRLEVKAAAAKVGLLDKTRWSAPMPTIWQGPNRVMKENWWAMANARSTALCLTRGEWLLALDDRCVLQPGFMDALREDVQAKKAYFGAYEKRRGLTVKNGVIEHAGIVTGQDSREEYVNKHFGGVSPWDCPGEWSWGCVGIYPTEWLLQINGWDTWCDGISSEDVMVGMMLKNNGLSVAFDKRLKIVEDRTQEFCQPVMRREDKGVTPNDRSHAVLEMLRNRTDCKHPINLREIRKSVLAGNSWPAPWGPSVDFFDNTPITEYGKRT